MQYAHQVENTQNFAGKRSMFILTCVGSIDGGFIRLASAIADDKNKLQQLTGRYEILGLSGTVCSNGLHLHITLGDELGGVCGGHLVNATIFTTAEIVFGELSFQMMNRKFDPRTGFLELYLQNVSTPYDSDIISEHQKSSCFPSLSKFFQPLCSPKASVSHQRNLAGHALRGGASKRGLVRDKKKSTELGHQTGHLPKYTGATESRTRQSMVYEDVASVLHRYFSHRGSLKGLCLADRVRRKGATMALACSILRNNRAIDALLEAAGLQDEEARHPPWLLRVVVCDATFGRRVVAPTGHTPALRDCMRVVRARRARLDYAFRGLGAQPDAGAAVGVDGGEATEARPAALPRQVSRASALRADWAGRLRAASGSAGTSLRLGS